MNILIYIPDISQEWGGIRQYAVTLIKMLREIKGNRYFIYHDLNDKEVIQAIAGRQEYVLVTSIEIYTKETIRKKVPIYRFDGLPVLGKLKFYRNSTVTNGLDFYCQQQDIRIVHCPYQYIPFVKKVKLITTMHDVQEIHFPEFFTAEERASRAKNYLDCLSRADCIVVSYNHIKEDLIKYFNVPEENIKTILLQMDKLWFDKFSDEDITSLPVNLNSTCYLLYPANAWKHKNHIRLMEAVAQVRDEDNTIINVAFTGDFNSEYGKHVVKKRNELILQEQVTFLGVMDEKVLFALYKGAVAVVIPTLYEAGSFPLMESIFLGVPVICSNVTSLPETIGDNDFIFDPVDIFSFKEKLKQLWTDDDFRKRSITNSSLQKQKLTNTNSVDKLAALYQSVC
ncbi:hypothetical protein BH11BAC5_BH11BAC5_30070 [soil metagenome]